MSLQRYFLEVMYKGTRYSGLQVQENAVTVQESIEKAFRILQKKQVRLTGSSRTDAGVHALQNFFHFDFEEHLHPQFLYKINAILAPDIVIKNAYRVAPDAHCRFDAISRSYRYYIYRQKNPFLEDRAYYFPYAIDLEKMREAAVVLKGYTDFTSFSKRNTQVKTFLCRIMESVWRQKGEQLVYEVAANRFLRGMVRGLTGTMLQVGRGRMTIDEFKAVIEARNCRLANFAVPGHGLFLEKVVYPEGVLGVGLDGNEK